jgi:ABC-2 type transport system permease protein
MRYRRVKGICLQYWYVSVSKLEKLLDIVFWGPMSMLIWAFVAVFIEQQNARFEVFALFMGGVFLWTMFNRTSVDVPVYVLEDFWNRSLYNLFVSPLTIMELYVALIIYTFLRMVLSFVALFLVALVALHFNIFSLDWVMMSVLFVPLILFAWTVGFFITGMVFRYGTRIQTFSWSFPFFLQPFLCVFYPIAALPAWLQPVAAAIPATWVFEGFRSMIVGTPVQHLLYMYAGNLLFLLLSMWYFVAGVRKSKRSGLLARS